MFMEEERRQEEEWGEKEEIARLWQEQVHTSQPIRQHKPVEAKRSEVPLTVQSHQTSLSACDRLNLLHSICIF